MPSMADCQQQQKGPTSSFFGAGGDREGPFLQHMPPALTQGSCWHSTGVGRGALLPGEEGRREATRTPLGSPLSSPKSALRLPKPTLLPTPHMCPLHYNYAKMPQNLTAPHTYRCCQTQDRLQANMEKGKWLDARHP